MKKLLFSCLIGASALTLTGCLSPVSLPTKTSYTLNPGKVHIQRSSPSSKTLLVMDTQASTAYSTRKMAYVRKPHQLAYFSKNRWASAPADQLNALITNALRRTHYFKAVVATPFVGTTNLKLATHLYRLQQNFLYRPSREQLFLSAQLINATSGKVIAEKNFHYSVPTRQSNPQGGVIAANKATAKLLSALTHFVVRNA